jgi:superfamily II DNA or RNA helicase
MSCPTGSGKTVMALSGLLPSLRNPVAWVTHRKELANQVNSYGSGVDVFMAQGNHPLGYQTIIIDEGHHACASSYREIIRSNPDSTIIALTATPYRLDGVGLGSCGFTSIVYGPDILELTRSGMLCRAYTFVPKSERTSSWSPVAAAHEIGSRKFNKAIAYCRTISDAIRISNLLNESGIRSDVVSSNTDSELRESLVNDFRNGEIKVICNHTIFTEGTDVPDVDMIILNRHTESRCLWKQMVGRGIRTFPGKSKCTVLDLAGNSVTHGSIYDREIYDLNGNVEKTESRSLDESASKERTNEYENNKGEELKEWKPQLKPIRIIESLRQLKDRSPMLRFRTASQG